MRTPTQPKKTKPENVLGWMLFSVINDGCFPGLTGGAKWPYLKALGQFMDANSRATQQAARKRLKALAQTAKPVGLRPYLSEVARTRIQARNRFPLYQPRPGGPPSIYDIRQYYEERRFLWAFLRQEALTAKQAERVELKAIAGGQAPILAEAYPYLGLDAETIANGLLNSDQAAHDTALQFNIAPTSVASLLSRAFSFS